MKVVSSLIIIKFRYFVLTLSFYKKRFYYIEEEKSRTKKIKRKVKK